MDRVITRTDINGDLLSELNLDGKGHLKTPTAFPFLDHMLEAFCRHGQFDLTIAGKKIGSPSNPVDILSSVGATIGEAFRDATEHYLKTPCSGHFILPMYDVLVQVSLDLFSRKSRLNYKVKVRQPLVRAFDIHDLKAFFEAFVETAGCNLHIKLEYGEDPHHAAEATFKCFARALDAATGIPHRPKAKTFWQHLKHRCAFVDKCFHLSRKPQPITGQLEIQQFK